MNDGSIWIALGNFPNGWSGETLEYRVMKVGSQAAISIWLRQSLMRISLC